MLKTTLDITHPEHDREVIADYRALYAGGDEFKKRIVRFLHQNEMEPGPTYDLRCREASYRSYVGPIVDYFSAFLMSSAFTARAKDDAGGTVEPDDSYNKFNDDCDGNGTDLDAFLRARAADALVSRRAWWLLELPSDEGIAPQDRAEWEARGLGTVVVHHVHPGDVLDWSYDGAGELEWVTTFTCTRAKRDPRAPQPKMRHEWRIYDRVNVEVYAVELTAGEAMPSDIPQVASVPHGFVGVPIVCLDVSHAFWVLNRIAAPQVEHFRLSSGLGWAIRRSCYAMPIFKLDAGADGDYRPPKMGTGYYLMIGTKDSMEWSAPPDGVFSVLRQEITSQKDEIYRMVHQMALGVENNAASVGRSGESKLADAEAIKVILTSLGALMRCAIEKTYQLISEARKDPHTWSVEGLDVYDDIDAAPLADAIASTLPLDIPSPTFLREVKTRLALALVAGADQATKDKIRTEIHKAITDEDARPQEVDGDGDPAAEGGAADDAADAAGPAKVGGSSGPGDASLAAVGV